MLNVNQLTCSYQQEEHRQQLQFSFTLQTGEVLAVLGPSGAGKSTLLALLAGFQHAELGDATFQGVSFISLPPHQRPLSILFQAHNLFPHLSVKDNIGLGMNPNLKLTPSQWEEVDKACEDVGLSGLQHRLPTTLSGGQAQRVALARCLVRHRPLLLLDEPFSALDPALRREMLSLVKQIAKQHQITIIMVTHTPEDARLIADHIAFIDDGKVAAFGTATDILEHSTLPALCQYLGKSL